MTAPISAKSPPETLRTRVDAVDWTRVQADLDAQGWAIVPKLLTEGEADQIAGLYDQAQLFRSQVIMARHGFGRGEYRYSDYQLPPPIEMLRNAAYPHLAPIANQWHERLNSRPVRGTRGDYQVKLNHGVSKLHSGRRHTLGVIFPDAA
jgi:hypothetical protein